MNLPLFPDSPAPLARTLAPRLRELADQHIHIGASSWKYEGWLGQVYDPERYKSRGKFSRRRFEDTCLAEYCETFRTVCGDFAFYQFPSEDHWQRLFAQVPANFLFTFKVPEEITCETFPGHPRYGSRAGKDNPSFLDVHLLREAFLRPLERYRGQLGVLIFEFGAFGKQTFDSLEQFLLCLDPFRGRSLPASVMRSKFATKSTWSVRTSIACARTTSPTC